MWQNKEVNGQKQFSITTTEIYEDSSFKFHKGTTVCRNIIIIIANLFQDLTET